MALNKATGGFLSVPNCDGEAILVRIPTPITVTLGTTLTASMVVSRILRSDPGGAGVLTHVLPTATDLNNYIPNAEVGDSFFTYFQNLSAGSCLLTMGAGLIDGGLTAIIAANSGSTIIFRKSSATNWTVYNITKA